MKDGDAQDLRGYLPNTIRHIRRGHVASYNHGCAEALRDQLFDRYHSEKLLQCRTFLVRVIGLTAFQLLS